ncbi:MAG TPA: hypothetical protein VGQ59_22000 [Cyclobacteriaceae bacterium]|nr:hypothetical protein [Cyclobacteriaceae bacterium]
MKTLIFVTLLLLNLMAYSQQSATTDDGKKVLLKADGTWEYLNSPSNKEQPNIFDFRRANWGMTKDQVKASETFQAVESKYPDILIYSGDISSLEAGVYYIFVDNKLVRTKYSFFAKHTNKNDYIFDYESINKSLIEKYGKPKKESEYWLNNLYKNDYDQRGFAVSLGHLAFYSNWDTAETIITSALTGENYKISHVIEYSSKKLSFLEDQKEKEKAKSEF